ncbi:hypothetical protein [Oerskovia gallyi]|uniref:DUF1508 domain-containing protein n=1 Tax=Oerskovia gallyi TaxID=2762226 RepID=A0ABR8V450_9CELL|nr:hypothetical protein [Oerskovia gallyi]MBD7999548.1 hypothetical protein [Oerskovia gallyi]
MRLTAQVIQQLLDQNSGYTDSTLYSGRNSSEERYYEIRGGELHVRSVGKTSWADSRYENEFVADTEQTRRFLRDRLLVLDTTGLD